MQHVEIKRFHLLRFFQLLLKDRLSLFQRTIMYMGSLVATKNDSRG